VYTNIQIIEVKNTTTDALDHGHYTKNEEKIELLGHSVAHPSHSVVGG
jgi:hypothetical protein